MIFSSLEIPFGSFHSFSFSLVYINIFLCVFECEHVRILSSTIFVTSVFCLYWLSVSLLLPITSNFLLDAGHYNCECYHIKVSRLCHVLWIQSWLLKSGASQVVLVVKNLPANAGDIRDPGSIPGLRRSPGGGHGNPLQYSCLETPMDRGAWWATDHGVAKSWTWLMTNTHTHK